MFCRWTGPIRQVREPSPLKVFCCSLVFYGSSTLLRSFRVRSVNLSTLFPGKPPRQFISIVSAHSFASNSPAHSSWISGRGIMVIEIFSWPISSQECVPDLRMESATGPYQADARPTEQPRPVKKFLKQESCPCSRAVSPPKVNFVGSILAKGDIKVPHTNGDSLYRIIHYPLSSSNHPDRTEILFKGASNR